MRPASVLTQMKNNYKRTRSQTPTLYSRQSPSVIAPNWETFFLNENGKLPLNNPAVNKDSEKLEYTTHLKIIKSQLNKSKFKWNTIENSLNSTKVELLKIENTEKSSIQKVQNSNLRLKNLENNIEKIKIDTEFALNDYDSYIYVKKRMTICRVFLEIKANKLRNSLKNFNEILKEQEQKLIKTSSINNKTYTHMKALSLKVESEQKWKHNVSEKLGREISGNEEKCENREEMQRRRFDIIETVANEDKNQRNNLLREELLLYRTWSKFLSSKLSKEKHKFSFVENAHAKIKALTGLSNVNDMVQKILTKEQNYLSLMAMIIESKNTCDKFYKKNIELENEMNEITVNHSDLDSGKEEKLKTLIKKGLKNSRISSERLVKLKFAKSFTAQWVTNFIKKLNGESAGGSIKELFLELRDAVHSKIKKYEKPRPSVSFSPVKFVKIMGSESLLSSELAYVDEEQSESSVVIERSLRRKITKIYNK